MTTMQDPQLEALVERAAERERQARQRAARLAFVPVLLALALLAVTGWQVAKSLDQLRQTRAELKTTQTELVQAKEQVSGVASELTQLRVEADSARRDLAAAQKELDVTRAELDQRVRDIAGLEAQLQELRPEVDRLNIQLTEVRGQLQVAQQFEDFEFLGDMAVTMKMLANRYPQAAELLLRIYEMQDVPWNPDGFTPDVGFNSPNFAAYVMVEEGWLPKDLLPTSSIRLQELLKMAPFPAGGGALSVVRPAVRLEPGDVIFYPEGYTLFYFRDEQERPFVIGMTPLGVLALQPSFAEPLGYAPTFR